MKVSSVQSELKTELDSFLSEQFDRFPRENLLKIVLHCHDCNSDEPDELLGRILYIPETLIPAKRGMEKLTRKPLLRLQ